MATGRRHDGRRADELRPVELTPGFVRAADGSCLIRMGRTRVICTASFSPGVPKWRQGSGLGWVTAEYGMLPASTGKRKPRPLGQRDGRSVEIQRIIGRVLRNVVRFKRLGENTVYLDCDVLEADGGTRTASITGAWVALDGAVARCAAKGLCGRNVLTGLVGAVSVGSVDGHALLDLDYAEDCTAETDMNVVMDAAGGLIEVQGTAEGTPFTRDQLSAMLDLAAGGISTMVEAQRLALAD